MTSRIMVVEVETDIAKDIKQRLKSLGYKVEDKFPTTGELAIQMASDLSPELILMAVRLGGEIDGIETAKRIRSFSDVPIIYLTSSADNQRLERALPTGAFGYLRKPFEDIELRSTIEMALYKHNVERQLRESEERYSLVAKAANDGIWDWNLKTNTIYYSTRWKEMIGYSENEIGNSPDEWLKRVHPEDRKQVQANLVSHINGVTPQFECEYRIEDAKGMYLWVLCRGLALRGEQDKPYRIAGSQSDISARKLAEQRLEYDALHDALTGLPNRALFMDRLENRMAQTKRNPQNQFALIYVDLDRFKVVNDGLGHAVGDQLLITVSQRLKQCLRPEDTFARLGGDEFAILLNDVNEIGDAIQATTRMMAGLHTTTILGSVERFPTASFGIAMFNSSYKTPGEILRDADSAMYRAKVLGRNRFQVFDESMHQTAVELITLEGELKRGIDRNEFRLDYQPIFSLASGELVGAEALVRWLHPKRGLLLPLEFIHVAEETGLIIPIGEYVLSTACKQTKAWRDAGRSTMWVSVNLSARQFQGQNLVDLVMENLALSGLASDGLRLEITETVAIRDMEYTIRVLNALNKMGIRTTLDDFGTGYSSLNYLKHFPFKGLKIDQSFVQDVLLNRKSDSLTKAIISMARSLEIEVVAEGVETDEQLAFLRSELCENAQGFLLSRPIPASEMDKVHNINKK